MYKIGGWRQKEKKIILLLLLKFISDFFCIQLAVRHNFTFVSEASAL